MTTPYVCTCCGGSTYMESPLKWNYVGTPVLLFYGVKPPEVWQPCVSCILGVAVLQQVEMWIRRQNRSADVNT